MMMEKQKRADALYVCGEGSGGGVNEMSLLSNGAASKTTPVAAGGDLEINGVTRS